MLTPSVIDSLKELIEFTLINYGQFTHHVVFEDKFWFFLQTLYSKSARDLQVQQFIARQIMKNCHKALNIINQQKGLDRYKWNNYTEEEKEQILNPFLKFAGEQKEKAVGLAKDYQNFVKSLKQPRKQLNIIFEEQEGQEIENRSIITNSEEQIEKIQQFKPPFLIKDNRTPEEIEEQIRKNQKEIEYFRKKLTKKDRRTPEEIKQDREVFKLLQEIIKNSR